MDNEIYEMAKNICECCGGRASYSVCGDCYEARNSYIGCSGLAEGLYDKGYRKIVWHKVADGDLPNITDAYLCEMKWHGLDVLFYSIERGFFSSGYPVNKDEVVAWMKLPEYKE